MKLSIRMPLLFLLFLFSNQASSASVTVNFDVLVNGGNYNQQPIIPFTSFWDTLQVTFDSTYFQTNISGANGIITLYGNLADSLTIDKSLSDSFADTTVYGTPSPTSNVYVQETLGTSPTDNSSRFVFVTSESSSSGIGSRYSHYVYSFTLASDWIPGPIDSENTIPDAVQYLTALMNNDVRFDYQENEANWYSYKSGVYGGGLFYGDAYISDITVNSTPIPPALYLFGSGLVGLVGVARRKAS